VAAVSATDGGNISSMAGGGEPIVDSRADGTAAHRRLARALVAGDQQDKAVASGDRLL
jgi:hypothetical protein